MYFEKIGEVGNGFGGNCDVYECDEINALPNAVAFSRAFIYSDEGIDVAMHSSKGFWVDTKGTKKFDTFIPEVIAENGTVAFTKDGEEVEVLSYGDTVTVTVTADEGYQVKTITLNGEEIENNSEITVDGDITLIAEFEEAPEPSIYTWNGTDTSEHDVTGANLTHYMGEAPSYAKADYIGATVVRKLGDDETEYVLTDEDITEYDQDGMYFLEIVCGEHNSVDVARGVEGYTDGLYFTKELEGSDVGQYTASMILA